MVNSNKPCTISFVLFDVDVIQDKNTTSFFDHGCSIVKGDKMIYFDVNVSNFDDDGKLYVESGKFTVVKIA